MDYKIFSLYSLVGSAAWCAVLCWLGVKIGGDISKGEMHKVTFWLLGFLVVAGAMYYFFVHRHMKARMKDETGWSLYHSSKASFEFTAGPHTPGHKYGAKGGSWFGGNWRAPSLPVVKSQMVANIVCVTNAAP
jgi:hypothetical protein